MAPEQLAGAPAGRSRACRSRSRRWGTAGSGSPPVEAPRRWVRPRAPSGGSGTPRRRSAGSRAPSAPCTRTSARSIAATLPLITTWEGEFWLATINTSSPRASSHRASASSVPTPISAVIVPGRSSPARCMASPRTTTIPERLGQGDGVGRHQRGELAERMSRRPHELEPEILEDAERRDVARQEGGLDELGRGEGALVVTPAHHVAAHRLRGLFQHSHPGGMRRPDIGHPGELRTLPREHHRERHRTTPSVDPHNGTGGRRGCDAPVVSTLPRLPPFRCSC